MYKFDFAVKRTHRRRSLVALHKVTSKQELASFLSAADGSTGAIMCHRPKTFGQPASACVFLDLSAMQAIKEHCPPDQVISVETGIGVNALNRHLQEYKQWLPACVADDETTLLDLINFADGGSIEQSHAVRDLILGLEVVLPGGTQIKTGGKVVKNVTGYDLTKMFVGSHATLGVPYLAHLRLSAKPEHSQSLLVSSDAAESLLETANKLILSALPVACLEIFDRRLLEQNESPLCLSGANLPAGHNYLLLLRVDGQHDVVEEIVASIKEVAAAKEIDSKDAQAAFANLSRLSLFQSHEFSASIKQALRILHGAWTDLGRPVFQYRPQSGRLRFFAEQSLRKQLVDIVRSQTDGLEPLAVAYSPEPMHYRVERIPHDDESIRALKSSIKMKFDPAQLLNPYAIL